MSDQIIRASEIAEYVFCRRAWWLSQVEGYATGNVDELQTGAAYHNLHGQIVGRALLARRLAYLLVFLAVGVFVFVIVRGL